MTRKFNEFLEEVGQHYDLVIIDTPPALAVTDAGVPVKGSILNAIERSASAYYGYGYGYGYYHYAYKSEE